MLTRPLAAHECPPDALVSLVDDVEHSLRWCMNCGALLDGDRFHAAGAPPAQQLAGAMDFDRWWVEEHGSPPTREQGEHFAVARKAWQAALAVAVTGGLADPFLVEKVHGKSWMRRIYRVGRTFVTDVRAEEVPDRLHSLREAD